MSALLQAYFKFIKRFLPDTVARRSVGIDIGVSQVRALELTIRGSVFEVSRWIGVPIEGGDVKSAMALAMSSVELTGKDVQFVTAVSGKGTLVRYIDMPRMPLADLRKAFLIEADKYFPFPLDTIYTDCHILDPKGSGKKMDVLIAAAKRDAVNECVHVLKDQGVSLAAVTLGPMAVANAVTVLPPPIFSKEGGGKGVVAVIDIGESGTNLMVIVDGVPRFSRDIFIGIDEIVRRVANVSAVSVQEAKKILYSSEERPPSVTTPVEAVLSNLLSELRLSFDYFVTERNMPIGQMCLIGEGVAISGLEALFAQGLDIPMIMWDPFETINVASDIDRDLVEKEGRCYITALGLALNDYDQS